MSGTSADRVGATGSNEWLGKDDAQTTGTSPNPLGRVAEPRYLAIAHLVAASSRSTGNACRPCTFRGTSPASPSSMYAKAVPCLGGARPDQRTALDDGVVEQASGGGHDQQER